MPTCLELASCSSEDECVPLVQRNARNALGLAGFTDFSFTLNNGYSQHWPIFNNTCMLLNTINREKLITAKHIIF